MARALSEIENEIRALASTDREQLLRALLEELDGPPDAEVEKAWLAEVQRRSCEVDGGTVEALPAHEVFARLRADLRK